MPVDAFVLVQPHADDAREQKRRALRAKHAARTAGADAGGFQHPFLRAQRHAVERKGEPRVAPRRRQDRAHRLLVRRQRLDAPHQHIEQPVAMRLFTRVGIGAVQHGLVDLLHMRGVDRQRGAEVSAQLRELQPGAAGDFGKPDVLEAALGKQRQECMDGLVAIRCAFGTGQVVGHGWSPSS